MQNDITDSVKFGERAEPSDLPQPPAFCASQDELERLIAHREYMERLDGAVKALVDDAKRKEKKLVADVAESWSLMCKESEKREGFTYSLVTKRHPSVTGGTAQTVELFRRAGFEDVIETKESIHHSRVKSILGELIEETDDGELDLSAIPSPLREHVKVWTEVSVSKRKASR
ncbi:hypothetical protein [Kordiimonas sp.]|uniref:hypothetical protein n=1 Tax=Kordiimonas sp. TaxID=1970157 RepID=UPI003A921E27